MLAILFLLSSLLAGVTLAYAIPARLRFEERLFMGTAIGLAALSLLTFATSLAFGLGPWTTAAVVVAANLGVGIVWSGLEQTAILRIRLGEEYADFRARMRSRRFIAGAAVYACFGLLLTYIFLNTLVVQDGNIYAGSINVWGDWSQHLPQVANFAYGSNLPPEFPVMNGQRLSYPFMTNFLSAILVTGGVSFLAAFKIPSVMLGLAGLGMLMSFTRYLAGGRAALLAPPLFYLAGGLGFVNFFDDFFTSNQSLGSFLGKLPHNYTQAAPDAFLQNINWINPIAAYVMPQRSFLFGLPIALTVLTLLYQGVRDRRRGLLLAAGLVAALLPLVHVHSFIFLGLITPVLVVLTARQVLGRRRKRRLVELLSFWAWFLVPVGAVAVPQAIWLTYGLDGSRFFRVQLGWTAMKDSPIWFWFKNAGLFLPLLIGGAIWLRRHGVQRSSQTNFLLSLAAAGAMVFLLANVLVFQPWDWDNSKLLVYWFVVSVPLVALVLVQLASRGRGWLAATSLVLVSLTLAGSLDVARIVQPTARIEMFNAVDQEMGRAIRADTAPDAVFLTSQDVTNPVASLGGRKIVMGYSGWLWSWGLSYQDRYQDVGRMFSGNPETPELLRRYDVDYVVIGPTERSEKDYQPNETYFRERYAVWNQFGETTVYKISEPLVSSR